MRKFIYTLFIFTMLFSCKTYADTISMSDFINSYGVGGEREIIGWQGSRVQSVASSEGPVLTICNTSTNRMLYISNAPFVYAYNGNPTSASPSSYSYISGYFPLPMFTSDNNTYYFFNDGFRTPTDFNNSDIIFDGTAQSFDDWIAQYPSNPNNPNTPDSNNLPMLKYGLTKKTVLGFPQITQIKEILTWDYTTEDIYKNNPTDFHMEMVASARWTTSPTGIGNIRDTSDKSINQNCKVYITNGGCNISANQYSWIYREIGKSLYAIAGEPWDDNSGYFMYVRTVQDSTGKASPWKVYNLAMNGLVVQEDKFIEPDGTEKQLPDSQKDIGNGQGVQPAKFDNDSSTDSDSDPTSVRYDEGSGNFNAGTVISTLKSTVNQITELPAILAQLLSFLPSWLTSLMVIGFGLAVTIGVVKMILH